MMQTEITACPAASADNGSLEVTALHQLGAEIKFNPSEPISQTDVVKLRDALLKHKMLLLRNQPLCPKQQIALTKLFGSTLHTAGPSLRYLPDHPEIFRIANTREEGNTNTGQYWHSDGHYLEEPSAVTVMHIVNATTDGATLIADSAAAYRRLPDRIRNILNYVSLMSIETGMTHPVIKKHSVTGAIGIYVNLRAIAIDVFGKARPEITEYLHRHLSEEGSFYTHQWKEGDTIILDNIATTHCGTPADSTQLRVLHRSSVTGDSVWWRHPWIQP